MRSFRFIFFPVLQSLFSINATRRFYFFVAWHAQNTRLCVCYHRVENTIIFITKRSLYWSTNEFVHLGPIIETYSWWMLLSTCLLGVMLVGTVVLVVIVRMREWVPILFSILSGLDTIRHVGRIQNVKYILEKETKIVMSIVMIFKQENIRWTYLTISHRIISIL